MDWIDIINGERERLKRIVAWMLAFALLAERAALATPEVRRHVLQMLRSGEFVVLDYLAELAEEAGCPLVCGRDQPLLQSGSTSADAIRLANTFRTLATMIAAIVHSVPEYTPAKTHVPRSRGDISCLAAKSGQSRVPHRFGCYPLAFADTS